MVVGLRLYANGPITRKVLGPLNLSLGVKVLIVVICALISVIVGIVAALLVHAPGTSKRQAVLSGGGAFAGSMLLCMAVLGTLSAL
ncbi:hypothetical protein ACH4MJ_30025 [Streptomyces anulatus]